jgi:hypothetical protein
MMTGTIIQTDICNRGQCFPTHNTQEQYFTKYCLFQGKSSSGPLTSGLESDYPTQIQTLTIMAVKISDLESVGRGNFYPL